MKLVEVLKEFKHSSEDYYVGEVVNVRDDLADYWCRAGWVRDTTGTIPTGNPGKDETILEVKDLSQTTLNEVM